jgi:4-hydroxy-tetrahydrodipicolinate reductase
MTTPAPRLALIGAGKMGRTIAQLAGERGWTVVTTLDVADNAGGAGITRASLGDAEVAVEFTEPSAARSNVLACARVGIPVVSGTTGWNVDDEVRNQIRDGGGALLHAANFSLGVHLVERLAAVAGRLMAAAPGFDAHMIETHHAAKKDAPSGTAAMLARAIATGLGRDVPITSVRVGSVPGTHEIVFDGPFEQVTLTHTARDRRVFADGALTAAAWLRGKRGVFTLADVLGLDEVMARVGQALAK